MLHLAFHVRRLPPSWAQDEQPHQRTAVVRVV